MTPKRIQRKRTNGWRMPPGTICVTRPSKWSNPYKAAENFNRADAIRCFRDHVRQMIADYPDWLAPLIGHNLACYCKLCPKHADGKPLTEHCHDCQPCHVDVLGAILYGEEAAECKST